ncbi:hypothetical protein HDV00_001688 [Rhizophlyctis rosea]|nr:hypothetical protein HDV00_001688 [Rhizophlyctis rosea]
MPYTYTIIFGTVRENRLGDRIVKFLKAEVEKRGHKALIVDPKGIPILEKKYDEYIKANEEPPAGLEAIAEKIRAADGYIVVTAEYNATMPPGLVNIMDYFLPEYHRKPAAIASYSYGAFGGARALTALRPFLSNLGLITIPAVFPFPALGDATMTAEGELLDKSFEPRLKPFLEELDWMTDALKSKKEKDLEVKGR